MTGKKKGPPLHPEVEGFLDRLDDKPADSATLTSLRERAMPSLGRASMAKINEGKKIPASEIAEVKRLFDEMKGQFPSENRCFEAIAATLQIKSRRVRHIIKGS